MEIDLDTLDDETFAHLLLLTAGEKETDNPFDGEDHARVIGEAWVRGLVDIDTHRVNVILGREKEEEETSE